jgi:hypothetical protein
MVTPAAWARSASWRRIGSLVVQRTSCRISGASASRSMVIGDCSRSGSALT